MGKMDFIQFVIHSAGCLYAYGLSSCANHLNLSEKKALVHFIGYRHILLLRTPAVLLRNIFCLFTKHKLQITLAHEITCFCLLWQCNTRPATAAIYIYIYIISLHRKGIADLVCKMFQWKGSDIRWPQRINYADHANQFFKYPSMLLI